MTIKQERSAQLILEIITELLMTEVTDPALGDVTVTEVKVDREIEYAEVYVHSMSDRETVMAGLDRANGFLRRELAARTSFRKTPGLRFRWDVAFDHGQRIEELLSTLHEPPTPERSSAPVEAPVEDEEGDD
jgi:ribosome-binding factor A